ncbi:ImmA/IrrE family metallo-endopeptidase [Chondromyces crocatus]|uniref:Uncharacterized protein n=1 Tax=Chondromyces crocatus TaxID=52 RepID=A0A0K1ELV2_CHOCO|nr:hypothetical protein [Chondromyces crocatus]AKT41578.1 uncharacterized protein CMC5_057850 [Chondromyces crocatus]
MTGVDETARWRARGRRALASAACVGALLLGLSACERASSTCPSGVAHDPPRARALLTQLSTTDEGKTLLQRLPVTTPSLCFGQVPVSAIDDTGTLLLDDRLPDAEAAARLGHLLLHRVEGSPAPRAGEPDCDAAVHRALTAEARAFALELRLRRALGVTSTRYAFEADVWRVTPEAHQQTILTWLVAHPGGGEGVDALGEGYRRRCEGR